MRKLIGLKHIAITWFLNQYLVDKEREGEHADANADYGGFAAMVKDGAYEDLRLVAAQRDDVGVRVRAADRRPQAT